MGFCTKPEALVEQKRKSIPFDCVRRLKTILWYRIVFAQESKLKYVKKFV